MYHINQSQLRLTPYALMLPAMLLALTMLTVGAQAQKRGEQADEAAPSFRDYKGVSLGMSADDVRAKLGKATEQGDDQDFFSFSEEEMAQVFYDASHKVVAVSINYLGDGSRAPKPQIVVGSEIEAKADGSMYRLVRFPKAGYWVSYSRTAGDAPIITITMKKMEQ